MAEQRGDKRATFRLVTGGRAENAPRVPLDILEVAADRTAPRKARRWAAGVAAQQGVIGMGNQKVELLTGELVGLAVTHSAPGATVRIEVTTTGGVVSVAAHHAPGTDDAPASPLETEQWGTALLRALSADCGIEEADGGTRTSWFQLDADA